MYLALNARLATGFVRGVRALDDDGKGRRLAELEQMRDLQTSKVPVRAEVRRVEVTPVGARIARSQVSGGVSGGPLGSSPVGHSANVAVLGVRGVMGFEPDLIEQLFYGVVSTQALSAEVDRLAADPSVDGVVLNFHTPGGDAMGMAQMADAVNRARAHKPVYAFVNRMAASAGYYQASQADKVIVAPDGMVGSIGVIATMADLSALFAKIGVRFVHPHHGEHKAVGALGAPITAEDEALIKEEIRPFYEQFVAAVAKGRGMTPEAALALATGDVWVGTDAMDKGLADAVGEMPVALDAAAAAAVIRKSKTNAKSAERKSVSSGPLRPSASSAFKEGSRMDKETLKAEHPATYAEVFELGKLAGGTSSSAKEPAATLAELDGAFPDETHAAFKIGQLRAGSTMSEAKARFAEAERAGLTAQVATLTKERDAAIAAKAEADKKLAAIAKSGVPAGRIPEGKDSTGGAGAETANQDATRAGTKFLGLIKAKAAELGKPVNHHDVINAAKKADSAAYAEWEAAARADPTLRV